MVYMWTLVKTWFRQHKQTLGKVVTKWKQKAIEVEGGGWVVGHGKGGCERHLFD